MEEKTSSVEELVEEQVAAGAVAGAAGAVTAAAVRAAVVEGVEGAVAVAAAEEAAVEVVAAAPVDGDGGDAERGKKKSLVSYQNTFVSLKHLPGHQNDPAPGMETPSWSPKCPPGH